MGQEVSWSDFQRLVTLVSDDGRRKKCGSARMYKSGFSSVNSGVIAAKFRAMRLQARCTSWARGRNCRREGPLPMMTNGLGCGDLAEGKGLPDRRRAFARAVQG